MRAVLTCPLSVTKVAMFAEMAWLEPRPELGALMRAAWDNEGRITPQVVDAALPGIGPVGARNLIAWCASLALCDAVGDITELGERVAEDDEAPVPEQGVYAFSFVDHPLIGCHVLAVERLASRPDTRFEEIRAASFAPRTGALLETAATSERFVIRKLAGAAVPMHTQAMCELRWSLDAAAGQEGWQLLGNVEVDGRLQPLQHRAEPSGVDLWTVARQWGDGPLQRFGRWDATTRRLNVRCDSLTDSEQESFMKTLTLERVEVHGKGSFERATLDEVPLAPARAEDAAAWAKARLFRQLRRDPTYRSRAAVRSAFESLVKGTPLARFATSLPAHATLVDGLEGAAAWAIRAPVDLAPIPLAREELLAIDLPAYGLEAS